MTYNEILDRLVEIIDISEKKKMELESCGIYDKDKMPNEKDFVSYYPYYIYRDYQKEFENLKNQELTYFLLSSDKYAVLKNQILIKECYEKIKIDSENKEDYEKIISIIKNTVGKKASDLIYIMGYFICFEDYNLFQNLCAKFSIGISKKLSSNKEEALEYLEVSKKQTSDQKKRLTKHMNAIKSAKEIKQELFNTSIKLEEKSQKLNDLNDNENFGKVDVILDGKYKEIIYLGMLGYLNIKMITELKSVMNNEEFKLLLEELVKYGIFSKEEILDIEIEVNKTIKKISDIDELVAFFAVRKDLNADALKALIPSIGISNYHYLMDQLFKFNAIDFEKYKKYLEEFGFLSDNFKQGR